MKYAISHFSAFPPDECSMVVGNYIAGHNASVFSGMKLPIRLYTHIVGGKYLGKFFQHGFFNFGDVTVKSKTLLFTSLLINIIFLSSSSATYCR